MKKLILPILIIFSYYCKGQSFNQMYEDSGNMRFTFDTCTAGVLKFNPVISMYVDTFMGKHTDTVQVSLLITDETNKNAHIIKGYLVSDSSSWYESEIFFLDDKLKRLPATTIIWQSK